jgi:3,4-dihydroxy-2-butanone 4-phosphate synthase
MRKIVTKIEIEFDEAVMLEDQENTMSDEDLLLHAATCFTEDIEQMVKYNELFKVALDRTTFVEIANDSAVIQARN